MDLKPYPGFVGPTNRVQSPITDVERSVNWFSEIADAGTPSAHASLYPIPGRRRFAQLNGPSLGHFQQNERAFLVTAAGAFTEVKADGTVVIWGAVAVNGTPATMCSSGPAGHQILIVSGGKGYVFDLLSNKFIELTGTLPKPVTSLTTIPPQTVASITSMWYTAYVTTDNPHGYSTGDKVLIEGSFTTEYNGTRTITVTGPKTFTYTYQGSVADHSTGGQITAIISTPPATVVCPNHGYVKYDWIKISGADQGAYNGRYQVDTVIDSNTFTYKLPEPAPTPATGVKIIADKGNGFIGWDEVIAKPIEALTSVGTTATVKITKHEWVTGQQVTIAGATPAAYNGLFYITVLDENLFTYTFPGGTSPASVNGTATIFNPPALMCDFSDGFGIVLQDNTNKFYLTALDDFTQWDGLDVAENSIAGDIWYDFIVSHRELHFKGHATSQVWVDVGDIFPYAPLPNLLIEQGAIGSWTSKRADNGDIWVGRDRQGHACVFKNGQGYTPQRISTFAIDLVLQAVPIADLPNIIAWTYQESGHLFYLLDIPHADTTPVFDIATNEWHERCIAVGPMDDDKWTKHDTRFHMFAFGKHLVGNTSVAWLFEQSFNWPDEEL